MILVIVSTLPIILYIICIALSIFLIIFKIKYAIINLFINIFSLGAGFIIAKYCYTEQGYDFVIISTLEKYENIINIIDSSTIFLFYMNFILAIILSIQWLKNSKKEPR
jgi:hypothetical protein